MFGKSTLVGAAIEISGAPLENPIPEKRARSGFRYTHLGIRGDTHLLIGVITFSAFVSSGLLTANVIF